MIRKFKKEDIYNIELNEFNSIKEMGFSIEDYSDSILLLDSYTLIHNGKIQCILSMSRLFKNIYVSGMLFSKDFDLFCAREIKRFIIDTIIPEFNITRLETESVDCDELNRWHKFLGFTSEGVKRKYFNDKDYRIWSIV